MATSQFIPVFPLISCLLTLFLFGVGFNQLNDWVNRKRVWPVSLSVVFGVGVTLLLPTLFFLHTEVLFWQSFLIYVCCFAASGIPMVFGNVHRHTTTSHKTRRIGNHSAKVRDDVVMDLEAMADQIVNGGLEVEKVVHRLHKDSGALRTL